MSTYCRAGPMILVLSVKRLVPLDSPRQADPNPVTTLWDVYVVPGENLKTYVISAITLLPFPRTVQKAVFLGYGQGFWNL